MTQNIWQSIVTILVIALVTLFLRGFPFILFSGSRPVPKFITYMGKVLPFAIIGILIVYCLKDVNVTGGSYGLPELISLTAVLILHKIKHNILISVGVGTLLYMLLVQLVFVY